MPRYTADQMNKLEAEGIPTDEPITLNEYMRKVTELAIPMRIFTPDLDSESYLNLIAYNLLRINETLESIAGELAALRVSKEDPKQTRCIILQADPAEVEEVTANPGFMTEEEYNRFMALREVDR